MLLVDILLFSGFAVLHRADPKGLSFVRQQRGISLGGNFRRHHHRIPQPGNVTMCPSTLIGAAVGSRWQCRYAFGPPTALHYSLVRKGPMKRKVREAPLAGTRYLKQMDTTLLNI